MSKEGNSRTLSTAVHVLRALQFIAENPRGVPVKAVARSVDLSLSSAYSLINSLRSEGFVSVSPGAPGLYVLGGRLADLYRAYVASNLQPERLLPFLEELRDRTSSRAYAAVWKRGDLEVAEILGRRGARELQDVSKGFRGAAHALAIGKIHLAALPEQVWPRYLQLPYFKSFSRNTIKTRPQLRHNLEAVRKRNLAYDLEEYNERVCCVAAPVWSEGGRLVAALGISVPARRFKHQHVALAKATRMTAMEASAELERALGTGGLIDQVAGVDLGMSGTTNPIASSPHIRAQPAVPTH